MSEYDAGYYHGLGIGFLGISAAYAEHGYMFHAVVAGALFLILMLAPIIRKSP